MIARPKRRLSNTKYLKILTHVLVIFLLSLGIPFYLTFSLKFFSLKIAFLFYLINACLAAYVFQKSRSRVYRFRREVQDLKEQTNILGEEHSQELKNHAGLQEKINRYHKLKDIIEGINQSLELEAIADKLSEIAFTLIGRAKGLCVLYLADAQAQRLNLFKAKKEDKNLIIKTKEGDIFDLWVLRHTSPLLIEDIKNDFRFDLEKLKSQDTRPIASLISAPFLAAHRFLGILRLDYPLAHFFSQDDLRFLVTVSDLGAVALENGELFQKTQELAIHDELTSLYTKGYFLERLREEYKRSMRQNRPLSLCMLDIDHFKNYNDKFGHTAGDIVLKALSQTMSRSLEGFSPLISRFGGEEFCVALVGLNKNKAMQVAEGLREKIENLKVTLRRQETKITVSIGVASLPDDAKDEDELIIKSDKAMYAAKQKGRNRVCGSP